MRRALLALTLLFSACGAGDFDSVCLDKFSGEVSNLTGTEYTSGDSAKICSCLKETFKVSAEAGRKEGVEVNLEEDFIKMANDQRDVHPQSMQFIPLLTGNCIMQTMLPYYSR